MSPSKLDIIGGRIFQITTPVLLCLLYTCLLVRIMSLNTSQTPGLFERTWFSMGVSLGEGNGGAGGDSTITANFIIVFSFLLIIVLITLIIMLVFYLEWHCCLTYYFYLPSFIIMAFLTPVIIKELLQSLNWFGIDLISLLIITYNLTLVGMISIFNIYVSVPLCLQQLYLIHNSCLLAVLIISNLPGWAPWMLLSFLVLWDLFAVLAPFGPLNLIVSMAEREGIVDMPGLVYSTEPHNHQNNKNGTNRRSGNNNNNISSDKTKNNATTSSNQQPAVPRLFERSKNNTATPTSTTPALTQSTSATPTPATSATTATTTTNADTPESALSTRIKTIESDEMLDGSDGGPQQHQRPRRRADLVQTNLGKMVETRDEADEDDDQDQDQERSSSRSKSGSSSRRRNHVRRNSVEEERGVTIGLGDFIFYSMLVGVISKGRQLNDYYAILAVVDAILVGLIVTLFILTATRRILPALPVSIGLGMLVACLTMRFVPEFSNRLAHEAIFV